MDNFTTHIYNKKENKKKLCNTKYYRVFIYNGKKRII